MACIEINHNMKLVVSSCLMAEDPMEIKFAGHFRCFQLAFFSSSLTCLLHLKMCVCVRVCVCVCVCVCVRERESEHNEYVDVYNTIFH